MYITQLLRHRVYHVYRFVAFIAGSFAAVLVLASVLDPDLVVHFEVTPHRTVFFYLTIFGSILAVARGMLPEENRVFDPELLMTDVIQYTHYMPDEWKDHLHSKKVCVLFYEFRKLFIHFLGASTIRRTIPDEDRHIWTGTHLCTLDTSRSLALLAQVCTSDHRFLQGVYASCGWPRIRVQLCRV